MWLCADKWGDFGEMQKCLGKYKLAQQTLKETESIQIYKWTNIQLVI